MGTNYAKLLGSFTFVVTLALLPLLLTGTSFAAADPLASDNARAVLTYLRSLPNRSESRIISGQFGEDSSEADDLASKIGKYPGLIGRDYIWTSIASANADLISHWNANGLVTMSYHFNNPLGGDAWNTNRVNLVQLITEGTSVNAAFKEQLDTLASGLSQLQDNGVPVLLRLFHEMNGGWFWWGLRNAEEFKSMWIYTFNYLTQEKGLHNLLWVFAPETNFNFAYYPGSQYVDIIGIDIYGYGSNLPKVGGYDQLPSFDKPFGITELGLCSGGFYYPEVCPPKDISGIITSIKTKMPKAVFWLCWGGVYSISYNLNGAQLMADPWIITRDEINLSDIISPLPELDPPTPPAPSDSVSPTVSISSPANGSTIYTRRSVTVRIVAKDNAQLKKIELIVNNKVYSAQTTNASSLDVAFSWRPGRGIYILNAKATDSSDNVGVSNPVKVTVR
jgi:mannan endo-1,4-beta-mannosidase